MILYASLGRKQDVTDVEDRETTEVFTQMVHLSQMAAWELGKCFDHSVLPKDSTEESIRSGCREAVAFNCAAFYSSSTYWTPVVREELAGTDVLVATGVAFPFGSASVAVKMREEEEAVARGCTAVDLAMNIGAL